MRNRQLGESVGICDEGEAETVIVNESETVDNDDSYPWPPSTSLSRSIPVSLL